MTNDIFLMVFLYLILLHNDSQYPHPHYTHFRKKMPHNAPLLSGLPHDAKRSRVRALFVSSTTHGLMVNALMGHFSPHRHHKAPLKKL
ncbi:hypothetical protein Hanom_Chr01g00029211 [Helianthus anomalus]